MGMGLSQGCWTCPSTFWNAANSLVCPSSSALTRMVVHTLDHCCPSYGEACIGILRNFTNGSCPSPLTKRKLQNFTEVLTSRPITSALLASCVTSCSHVRIARLHGNGLRLVFLSMLTCSLLILLGRLKTYWETLMFLRYPLCSATRSTSTPTIRSTAQ